MDAKERFIDESQNYYLASRKRLLPVCAGYDKSDADSEGVLRHKPVDDSALEPERRMSDGREDRQGNPGAA